MDIADENKVAKIPVLANQMLQCSMTGKSQLRSSQSFLTSKIGSYAVRGL